MTRDELLQNFLASYGWGKAVCEPLASDASARTYARLTRDGESAILMNSPLSENPDKFVLVDSLLRDAGIHAPKILASDLTNGFLLLEDFGNDTFTRLLDNGADMYQLYKKGIDVLIKINKNIPLPQKQISDYSLEKLMNGVLMLPNWFVRHVVPGGISEQARAEFIRIWTDLNTRLVNLPKTLVLLDYHADNLMITPEGDCGVLDFQDARTGPVTYDLMSLLEDERRDVPKEIRDKLIDYYLMACPEVDLPEVRKTTPIVAMQRHTRVIGIFVRLFLRDKKEKYLKMIPFVWQLVEKHLDNPIFAPYRAWLDKYIPKDTRHKVWKPEEIV